MKVYYWSPHTSYVATIKAVYNSALSLTKYNKDVPLLFVWRSVFEFEDHVRELLPSNSIEICIVEGSFRNEESIDSFIIKQSRGAPRACFDKERIEEETSIQQLFQL